MISKDHLHDELKVIDEAITAEKDQYRKASLIAQKLTIKLLHSVRTNQMLQMKHEGVEVMKPKRQDGQKASS